MTGLEPGAVLAIIAGCAILIIIAWMCINLYQKCGPNQAMIISGFGAARDGSSFKIIVGGGDVVLPMLQQKNLLSLEVMTLEIHAEAPMITKNGVPLFVEGVAQVKVKGDNLSIAIAAEHFLGKSDEEIATIARESILGQLRAIVGTMSVEELIQSFNSTSELVRAGAVAELSRMGLTVVSFTFKEIKDNVGYLESLGRQQTAEAKRAADIAVAQAYKDTAIAQAQAQRASELARGVGGGRVDKRTDASEDSSSDGERISFPTADTINAAYKQES